MAPSTVGSFLRSFTFGHVRQLEAVVGETLRRARAMGAGPGAQRLVIDVDSTICEVAGPSKQGAAYGYTKVLGYPSDPRHPGHHGEVLHARMRMGSANTALGTRRFIDELVARVRRAGATGEIVMRFDSGSGPTTRARHGRRGRHRGPASLRCAAPGSATVRSIIPSSRAAACEQRLSYRRRREQPEHRLRHQFVDGSGDDPQLM